MIDADVSLFCIDIYTYVYPSTVYILMYAKYACLSLNICIQCSTVWLCICSIMCWSNVPTYYNTLTLFRITVKYYMYYVCIVLYVRISACTMMYTFMYTVHPTVTCTVTVLYYGCRCVGPCALCSDQGGGHWPQLSVPLQGRPGWQRDGGHCAGPIH